jgi:ABC-2 type transport system ATP-binding protein
MLSMENLTRDFGPVRAVDDVSFKLAAGDILGFIGPNGAGKSTTLRMLTGYLSPTSGKVFICGRDLSENEQEAKSKIGYLPERAPLWPEMTVLDLMRFSAEVRGMKSKESKVAIEKVLSLCFLEGVRHFRLGTLSKGYRQRACFAQSMLHDPPILILDEPTDGLDPNQKHEVREIIRSFGSGKAVLFSTHLLEEVDALCTRVVVMSRGRIVADESKEAFRQRGPDLAATFRRLTLETHT